MMDKLTDPMKDTVQKRQPYSLWLWLAVALLWSMLLRQSYQAMPWDEASMFGLSLYELRRPLAAAGMCVGMLGTAIACGCLFWLCLSYITGAKWGKSLRRALSDAAWSWMPGILVLVSTVCCLTTVIFPGVAEFCGMTEGNPCPQRMPWVLDFSVHEWWNPAWVYLRMGVLLVLLWVMNQSWRSVPFEQSPRDSSLIKGVAAFSLILPVFMAGILGFDLFGGPKGMSLSMFPVAMVAYLMIAGLAFGVLVAGIRGVANIPWRKVGAMFLALVMIKGYVAFSQYLIVWYADIPAETAFYVPSTWDGVLILGAVLQLIVPFIVLLFPALRRRVSALKGVSVCILLGCGLEALWLFCPSLGITLNSWTTWGLVSVLGLIVTVTVIVGLWECGKRKVGMEGRIS